MYSKCILVAGIALLGLFGCTEKRDYIVSVNGHELTEQALCRKVEMMVKLRMMNNPKVSAQELDRHRQKLRSSYEQLFTRNVLIGDFAAKNKIEISDEITARFHASAVKSCSKSGAKTWEALCEKLGGYAPEFTEQVEEEMRQCAVREWLAKENPTNLPPDFAAQQIEKIKEFNRTADATNALIFARATNVWQRLVKGADFGEMVQKFTEVDTERADRGEWGTLDWKQIQSDPYLYEYAKKLKPGEFSPPIEADGGLMIARIDEKKDDDCKISRIFFRLPMFAAMQTEEQILKAVRTRHALTLFNAKMAELKARARIVRGDQAKDLNLKTKQVKKEKVK